MDKVIWHNLHYFCTYEQPLTSVI